MKHTVQGKNLSSLNQRFSKKFHKKNGLDNRGASLVMVLMVMALIFVLVSIVLMITVTNVFMKDAAEKNTKNFYDAEASMDEIRAGLATVCNNAVGYAKVEARKINDSSKFEEEYKKHYAEYIYETLMNPDIGDSNYTGAGIPADARHRQYRVKSFSTCTASRGTAGTYDSTYDGLESCLKGTKQGAADRSDHNVGGIVDKNDSTSTDLENYINIYPSEGRVELLGVKVKYTDKNNYVTTISTDIELNCPPVTSAEESTLNNILYYTLITDDSLQLSGGTGVLKNEFEGNIFAGYNDSQIKDYKIDIKPGGTSSASVGQICYFLGGGNIELASSDLTMSESQMWIKGMKLLGKGNTMPSGSFVGQDISNGSNFEMKTTRSDKTATRLYMQDDLNLGNAASIKLAGELFGFGNPDDLEDSNVYLDSAGNPSGNGSLAISYRAPGNTSATPNSRNLPSQVEKSTGVKKTIRDDITEKPYEYSSAILVNGRKTKLDLSGLISMKLAGSAYVNANPNTNGSGANNDIRTGESISIKPSQRAYLVPADNLTFNANPVSGKVFDDELKNDYVAKATLDTNGYYLYYKGPYQGQRLPVALDSTGAEKTDVDAYRNRHPVVDVDSIKITASDYITGTSKADGADPAAADSWKDYIVSGYDKSFRQLGVSNIRVAAFPGGPIRYFFMSFKDDKSANAFYKLYYQNMQHTNLLSERLKAYTNSGSSDLKLPNGVNGTDASTNSMYFSSSDDFYFNGNLIASGNPMIKVSDTWTAMNNARPTSTAADDKETDMLKSSGTLYDSYYSLLTNLTTREDMITDVERTRTLFNNIIDESQLTAAFGHDVDPSVPGYSRGRNKRYYVSDAGKGCILGHDVDGTGKIEIAQEDINVLGQIYQQAYGGNPSDATLNLIVTDTDVELGNNVNFGTGVNKYEGLILAKGKIIIDHNMDITQNASAVIVAMNSVHVSGTLGTVVEGYPVSTPRDVFRNPSLYAVGGRNLTGTDSKASTTTLPSLVTYENWTRE